MKWTFFLVIVLSISFSLDFSPNNESDFIFSEDSSLHPFSMNISGTSMQPDSDRTLNDVINSNHANRDICEFSNSSLYRIADIERCWNQLPVCFCFVRFTIIIFL